MKSLELVELVRKEADALRANATAAERDKLDFYSLKPTDSTACIYGQMTGNCWSKRSYDLIDVCTEKKISSRRYAVGIYSDTLCGIEEDQLLTDVKDEPRGTRHWSPIEVFIALYENRFNGNNKALVKYIKGETDTLEFEPF